jgi:hypothetical protein
VAAKQTLLTEYEVEGILAVAFLVGCAHNLLICEDLSTPLDRFPDMEACRTALPGLIRHHEGREGGPPVILGKCRLTVRLEPSLLPPTADVLAGSWP